MDRVRVAWKVHRMDAVVREVPPDPLDALQVRGEPVLDDKVAAKAQHVGGVEQRLFFRRNEELLRRPFQPLRLPDFVGKVVGVIILIRQARLWRGLMAEIRVFLPILLHQRAIAEIFEPAAAIGHRRLKDLMPDRQQHVARRHAAELAVGVEIRRRCRLGKVDGRRAINANAALAQHVCEIVQKLIAPVNRLLRALAPLAAHVAVFGNFRIQRGLRRGDVAVVGPAHDDVFQRVPLVPAFHLSFFRRPGHARLSPSADARYSSECALMQGAHCA